MSYIDRIRELAEDITADAELVPAQELGLDYLCGMVYVGEDFLATTNRRVLDYYGGFEYIDAEFVSVLGNLTIYSIEDSSGRVREHLEQYSMERPQ